MRIEPYLVSREVINDKPKEVKPVSKLNEENGRDKPERDRREDLNRIVDLANKAAELFNRHLKFRFSDKNKRTVIQIIDNDTQEVVREIPPEKLFDMVDSLQKAVGLIIDKHV